MTHPLKNVENLLMLMINAGAALAVAGAAITLIRLIEAVSVLVGVNPGYHMPEEVSLSISIAAALFATWKVNGRFIYRGD